MNRLRPWLLVGLALLAFWQVSRRQQPLLQARRDFHLSKAEPLENMPPLVAFTTVAMGGFRGILADVLWLRATQLQQQGKYFELVQLADWITKLHPRLAQVWAFHGWNMAYNISAVFNDPADRWRWVRQGISLLRDQALAANPGEPSLYRELGWIFQHKIGSNLDLMHLFYKRQWAEEMTALFDGPRPDYEKLPAETARRMRELYKLDPRIMAQVEREFGPLDWRLPQAHAVYWAWRGKAYARGFDALQLDRMILQALADAALQGSLFSNPAEEVFVPGPNLALFATTRRAFEQAIAAHPDETSIRGAHRNFLQLAVLILYTHHRLAEAGDVFAELRQRYPEAVTTTDLDRYVLEQLAGRLADLGQREALSIISGALQQSWFWLAMGDVDRAQGFQQLARTAWREYMRTRTDPEVAQRLGLPPFEELSRQARETIRSQLTTAEARERLGQQLP